MSLTVVCDVYMIDSIVVQYFNQKGINIISLQHGIYSRLNPISMKNSMSKYLLVYGKSTRQECLYFGLDEKKIKKLECLNFCILFQIIKY